ncbi:MAG TPA: tetratricopeptide repeat protein, partial [bacterium]|nr:tetratricopeptide repeat protein [bacterium]
MTLVLRSGKWIALVLLAGLVSQTALYAQRGTGNKSNKDTVALESVSSEDLLKLKEELESQRNKLETERVQLLDKGIKQSKEFLDKSGSGTATTALVLLQRAEYLYQIMNDNFSVVSDSIATENQKILNEYERRKEDFRTNLVAQKKTDKEIEQEMNQYPGPQLLPDPEMDYTEVIKTYQQLMDNFPESPYVVDAMYNIAFFREAEGRQLKSRGDERFINDGDRRQREALKIYQDLAVRFPDSKYAGECYNRIGEYYFQRGGDADLQKAIKNYSKVLDYPQAERFQEAVYKLAWTHYRLGDYPKAISYFTYLVDDVDSARYYNNFSQELDVEALVYIGISFNRWGEQIDLAQGTADGGYKLIKSYIDEAKLSEKRYAPEIIWQLGESYNLEQKDTLALYAYNTLINTYPLFWRTADAQFKVINTFERMQRGTQNKAVAKSLLDSVIFHRYKLYNSYRPGSDWSVAMTDKDLVIRANRMARDVLVDNILYYYGEASLSNDLKDWRVAMDFSRQFITFFPVDTFAYKFHYNMAFIEFAFFKMLDTAYEDFVKVATLYPYDQYRFKSAMNAYVIADSLYRARPFARPKDVPMDSILPITPSESKLLDAINNYARLFPDTSALYPTDSLENPKPVMTKPGYKTPDFLAYAGGIYFSHNDFARASQYFNTIVTRYPKSDKARLAQRYLMQTYRDKKDFRSSEIVARKLLENSEVSAEQKTEAVQVIFFSIFKHAEYFQGKKENYKAAREFQRAYEEGKKLGYGKRNELAIAMFNSGVEYYNSKELKRSIAVFEAYADTFKDTKEAPAALWNVQNMYSDMKEMKTAAQVGERLVDRYPNYSDGSRSSEVALYNSEYFFEQSSKQSAAKGDSNEAKDLNRQAIRVSEKFVKLFPKSQYTPELDFNIAKLY